MNSKQQKRVTNKAFRLFLATALLAVVLGAHPVPVAHAGTTITVTTAMDELNDDGDCSLREAIQAANTDSAVDACPAGSGADTIILSAYEYMPMGEDFDITDDVTIQGEGPGNTRISAYPPVWEHRLFTIDDGSYSNQINVTLSDLTIRDGTADTGGTYWSDDALEGGAIWNNDETLTLTNCVLYDNQANGRGGAIYTYWGVVNINHCVLKNNYTTKTDGDFFSIWGGGAIYNQFGTVNILDSTISSNSTYQGGGDGGGLLSCGGPVNIANSTFSGNSAGSGWGGAICGYGLNVSNSTFSGNSSSGGAAGIHGTATLQNSIITDNASGNACSETLSGSNNLIDDTTCGSDPGFRLGSVTNFDTTLGDNGGSTQTHALLFGSNAVNNVSDCTFVSSGTNPLFSDNETITSDQRGEPRPEGSACDIGAYEASRECTGPGGVGNVVGTSDLELWLKADDGTGQTSDGSAVSTWQDKSGNSHDVSQSTSTYRPTFQNGAADTLNGEPVARFDGLDDYLNGGSALDFYGNDGLTILAVVKPNAGLSSEGGLVARDESDYRGYSFAVGSSGVLKFYVSKSTTTRALRNGSTDLRGSAALASCVYRGAPANLDVYVNGANDNFTQDSIPGSTIGGHGPYLRVASTGYEEPFYGDIAELAVYGVTLNSAERTLVENYLSAKYDITISNDKYTGNDSAYVHDVAGIGQESDGSNAEAHSGGLIVSASSGFLQDNGDYLMVGHNDATSTTDSGCPSGVSSRWSRVWCFDKTDQGSNGGNVDITFDFSESGMGGAPSGSYSLLKRSGTSGPFSSISTSSSISGDQVIFSDVDSTELGSYFTLGEGTPTAVTLQSFTARPAGKDLTGFGNLSGLGMLVALGALGVATAGAAAELSPLIIHCFQIPFRRERIMNSKQQKRTTSKAFRLFLAAALLTGLVGMTGVAYASDGAGNALDFDGTDEYVNIEAVADDMAGQQSSFTFSAWIKAASTHTGSTKGTILGVNENDGCGSIKLCLFVGGDGDSRNNRITVYDGGSGGYEITGPVIGDDTWHHVTYVRSETAGTLYVDGVSEGAHTADYTFDSDDLWSIGQEWDYNPWGVSDALDGQADEVRIWKTALDQSTIQDWMHGELTTAHPNKANLVGYWKLNDGSGTAATDSSPGIRGSGSANNGTLQNMEEGDWVTSTAPIGDTTVGDQTDITAMWSAQTDTASDGLATGLDIANVSFTNDVGDDIVFGHNNASETTTDDCPSGVSPRWQRVWYLDKTDVGTSGGNVNLTFDFSDAGEGTPGASNYTLLKRSGETGDFTSVTTTSNVSGDQVIFSDVDSTDLGSYFTLGEGTPTAVTLSDFTASPARGGYGFVLPLALVAVGAVGGTLLLRARRRRV